MLVHPLIHIRVHHTKTHELSIDAFWLQHSLEEYSDTGFLQVPGEAGMLGVTADLAGKLGRADPTTPPLTIFAQARRQEHESSSINHGCCCCC